MPAKPKNKKTNCCIVLMSHPTTILLLTIGFRVLV